MFIHILLSSILENNRVIVIENRQKVFQLQLQLSTFENFQLKLQLQLQQNRVINYNFVNYNYNFSKPGLNNLIIKSSLFSLFPLVYQYLVGIPNTRIMTKLPAQPHLTVHCHLTKLLSTLRFVWIV